MFKNFSALYFYKIAALLGTIFLFFMPDAAYASKYDDCNSKSFDRIIKGCTAIITSGSDSKNKLAVAYFLRGQALFRGKYFYSRSKEKTIRKTKPEAKSKNGKVGLLGPLGTDDLGTAPPVKGAFERLTSKPLSPDTSKPVIEFTRAIKLNPRYTDAYFARAVAYDKWHDTRAIADYVKVLQLKPDYPNAKTQLANAKLQKRIRDIFGNVPKKPPPEKKALQAQKAKELTIVKKKQSQKPSSKQAETYKNQGNVYFNKRDYRRAIALFTKAIQVAPNYAPAYNNRGNSYGKVGEYARGIADLTKALALNPKTADVYYYNRAMIYRTKGDYTRAIADFTTAHELNPKDPSTLLNRGVTYLWSDNPELAVLDFQRVVVIAPKSAYYRYHLGKGLYHAGKTSKAMQVWKNTCELASGKRTKRWQRLLKKSGHYSGTPDGICDFGVTIAFASCAESKCKM